MIIIKCYMIEISLADLLIREQIFIKIERIVGWCFRKRFSFIISAEDIDWFIFFCVFFVESSDQNANLIFDDFLFKVSEWFAALFDCLEKVFCSQSVTLFLFSIRKALIECLNWFIINFTWMHDCRVTRIAFSLLNWLKFEHRIILNCIIQDSFVSRVL